MAIEPIAQMILDRFWQASEMRGDVKGKPGHVKIEKEALGLLNIGNALAGQSPAPRPAPRRCDCCNVPLKKDELETCDECQAKLDESWAEDRAAGEVDAWLDQQKEREYYGEVG